MKAILCLLCVLFIPVQSNQVGSVIIASGDTIIRKDREDQNFGSAHHLTITNDLSKRSRIALIKFDLSHISDENLGRALLRLSIADVDNERQERDVLIKRIGSNFDESDISWNSFESNTDDEEWIKFRVHNDHVGKVGQVDVTSLVLPGEDLYVALHTVDGGHVKFASREHHDTNIHPKLIFLQEEL
mmetsp:Transcript_337/g.567  ORF Transcript_337/g.567 Transcript_337/m.567 type:complete len:187 (+) Transcript_337:120-680(+)